MTGFKWNAHEVQLY